MICVFDYHFIFPEQENVYSKYVKEKTIAFYPIGESPLYVVELNWWIKKVKGTTAISFLKSMMMLLQMSIKKKP